MYEHNTEERPSLYCSFSAKEKKADLPKKERKKEIFRSRFLAFFDREQILYGKIEVDGTGLGAEKIKKRKKG